MRSVRYNAAASLATSRFPGRKLTTAPERDRIRMRPELHAVDAAETGNQRLAERARSFFDRFAADPGLEGDCLTEADDRGFVPLSHRFHSPRDADRARIGADDARVDTALRASVNVEHPDFFGTAWPLVRAATKEVRLDVGEIEIQHAKRARTIHQRQNPVLARYPTKLRRRKDVTDGARVVREREHARPGRDGFRDRVDVVVRTWMRCAAGQWL